MKIRPSSILCLICLVATVLDESDAFSGLFGSRNRDWRASAPSVTSTRRARQGDVHGSAITDGRIPRTRSKSPPFVASLGATNDTGRSNRRQRLREIANLRARLHVALLLFSRRLSQLSRIVRVPLAVCSTAVLLRFGGLPSLAPSAAHAAKPTATIRKAISNRPQPREKEPKAGTEEAERAVLSNANRSKQRLIVALGFGASLYSIKTTRERAQSDGINVGEAINGATDETTPNNGEGPEVVVVDEAEPATEEETVVDPQMAEDEARKEESSQISFDTVSPSTTSLVKEERQTKRDQDDEDEDETLMIQFLDSVGSSPEVVFGFLGSTLAFLLSEDILISGITFALIFYFFEESGSSRAASVDDRDEDEEERVTTAAIVEEESEKLEGETEPEIEEKNEVDSEVILEDYRPEELMNAEVIGFEESPKKTEETVEEIKADAEGQAQEATKGIEEELKAVEDTSDVVNNELIGAGNEAITPIKETELAEQAISAPEDVGSMIEIAEEVKEVVPKDTAEAPQGASGTTKDSCASAPQEESYIGIEMNIPDQTNGAEEVANFSRIEAEEPTKMSIEEMAYKVVMDLGLLNRASTTMRGENESDK